MVAGEQLHIATDDPATELLYGASAATESNVAKQEQTVVLTNSSIDTVNYCVIHALHRAEVAARALVIPLAGAQTKSGVVVVCICRKKIIHPLFFEKSASALGSTQYAIILFMNAENPLLCSAEYKHVSTKIIVDSRQLSLIVGHVLNRWTHQLLLSEQPLL